MPPVLSLVGLQIPEMQGIPDTYFAEGVAEEAVVLQKNIIFTHYKDDFHFFHQTDKIFVAQIGDVQAGHIVINILVAVPFEQVFEMWHGSGQVIPAAQSYHFVEQGRAFEGEVSGMISAHAAARGDKSPV